MIAESHPKIFWLSTFRQEWFIINSEKARQIDTKEILLWDSILSKITNPEEIRNQYPIDAEIQAVKDARDKELRDVFTGKSDKFLAIIGPCSADNEDAVLDYLTRLRNVQEKIADKVLIVPRVYTNKPRTTGEGYKGMVHQPDPEKQPNLLAGLVAIRKMHIHAIRTSGMTCADEMLYPENYRYLSDLLSYVAVGARSVEDQQHRLTVSGMEVPAGMKIQPAAILQSCSIPLQQLRADIVLSTEAGKQKQQVMNWLIQFSAVP